jgi:hypothetical protein
MQNFISNAIRLSRDFLGSVTREEITNSFTNATGVKILSQRAPGTHSSDSSELSFDDVSNFILERRDFRHAYLASMASFVWGIVETIILAIGSVFAHAFDREKKVLTLTKKCFIECSSNGAISVISFIGQFSPSIGQKAFEQVRAFFDHNYHSLGHNFV